MPFGFEYLMVFLPEVDSTTFLLFTHRPDGATALRNYSRGKEQVLQAHRDVRTVLASTEQGSTRFHHEAYSTSGQGVSHWTAVTRTLNRKWLQPKAAPLPSALNRASKGSRRQLQDYVNQKQESLSAAVLAALPPRISELGARIRWVSPLAQDDYREYRDDDFLRALDLGDISPLLREFWPAMGPCWDALGMIYEPNGHLKPSPVLVEAKSHINEIHGGGCHATAESLQKIERALAETRQWLGIDGDPDWRGHLYQYANRLAHLYFLRKKVGRGPAWLVNLYFLDDPIGPTSEQAWKREIETVKSSLGLLNQAPGAVDVFLPALCNSGEAEVGRLIGDGRTKSAFLPRD